MTQEQIMKLWGENERPLVSVMCVAFNHERYISQALDGFLLQKTNFPFEVVIHDDASTDKTADIIRDYEEKYPKIIKPIYETENQYSKKDNTLTKIVLSHLTGKYVAFCEGDDYWTNEDKLQMQVDFLESHPDYGFCCTDADIYDEKTNEYERAITKNKKNFLDFENAINSNGYFLNVTWVFKREIYDKIINEETDFYIDAPLKLFYDLCLNTKAEYLDVVTGVYRRNPNGLSYFSKGQDEKQYAYFKSWFRLIKKYLPKFQVSESTVKAICKMSIDFLLIPAIKFSDTEIINEYISFLKDSSNTFWYQLFDSIMEREKENELIRKSKPYRLGTILLYPLKKFLKLFRIK